MSPLIEYVPKRFSAKTKQIIDQANAIIADYTAQGYDLTLRQLYYQFVSRDLLPNESSEYKRLSGILSDARLAGLVDWDAITDRTRNLTSNPHWSSASDIIEASAVSFAVDKWQGQQYRPEVWIEKEALAGVFGRVCEEMDVSYFSCRGYGSSSEMWVAAQRLLEYSAAGQTPVILHFGDHDPSGIDMTRDIEKRLTTFGLPVRIERLALNMEQIEHYKPPPNPAKDSDTRSPAYVKLYGNSSWELDALDPSVLSTLARQGIERYMDAAAFERKRAEEERARRLLEKAALRWQDVTRFLGDAA